MKQNGWLATTGMILAGIGMTMAQIAIPDRYPGAATTGPVGAGFSYAELESSGSMTISTPGVVISGLDVSGTITVTADSVTIMNCRIRFGGTYGIVNEAGGLKVEYCEVAGTGDNTSACIKASNITISHCNIYGAEDGIKTGSNTVVEHSWVHDLRKWDGTHNDCLQNSGGGSHIIIRFNTLQAPYQQSNAVSQNATNFGPIDDMLFEGNFISGGGYCIQLRDKGTGYGFPTNIRFVRNVFEKDSYVYNILVVDGDGVTYTCNRYNSGELIAQNPTCNDAEIVFGMPQVRPASNGVAGPNPMRNHIRFILDNARAFESLTVYDGSGKKVWSLSAAEGGRSAILTWNGRIAGGESAAPGIYTYRISSKEGSVFGRIIKVE